MRLILLIITGTIFIASCSPQRRLTRLAASHPDVTAKICGTMFPVRESNTVRTGRQTDTLRVAGDTIYVDCDSVLRSSVITDGSATGGQRMVRVPVKCPDRLVIRDSVWRDSIVVLENTAALTALTKAKSNAEMAAASNGAAKRIWMWIAISLAIYILARIILRMWLKINLP